MNEATPGPWEIIERKADGGALIVGGSEGDAPSPGNCEANARLIVAAWDMLAALRKVVARDHDGLEAARAAIAKATGERE